MNSMLLKEAINKSFSRQAGTYTRHADVQARSAAYLAQFISGSSQKLPPGSVLEIGCGTGLFTKHLLSMFSDRVVVASDVSESMLAQCQALASNSSTQLKFSLLDADNCQSDERYALITASFSLQWVTNILATVEKLLDHLKPDGQLIFTVPLNSSFGEWRRQCAAAGVPFTGNNLPDKNELVDWCKENSLTVEWQQQPIVCYYSDPIEFFRSLKGAGAATSTRGITLTQKELRRLIQVWKETSKNDVQVTYDVLCARITRGYDK
ncbi:MAG TPA: methyltransferase domain-containing protein [Drouetiella sp.]